MNYKKRSKEDLRNECRTRGLKDTGGKELLVERLETADLTEKRLVDATRKRERDDRTQEEKDAALLSACRCGTLKKVIRALDAGANCNAVDSKNVSALMKACMRHNWVVAETIVKELLRRGAHTLFIEENGWTALHWAVTYSSCAVAELVSNKTVINQASLDGGSPLIICCTERLDDESIAIARMLLDHGANIEQKDKNGSTSLSLACEVGGAAMVELLLSRKANANTTGNDGGTPLMWACINKTHGEVIIPLLIEVGADPLKKDDQGKTALNYAFASGGGAIIRAVSSYIPAHNQLRNRLPPIDSDDPIGSMREAVRYGFDINRQNRFRNHVIDDGVSAAFAWSILRTSPLCFDSSENDIFRVMAASNDPALWSLVARDLAGQHHPTTGDTLLHVAARGNKMYAVESLMRQQVNPFWRNNTGQLAVNETQDKDIRARLAAYSTFRPTRFHAAWFGPYFLQRAVAFLLVVMRWKTKDVRVMPKDVVLEIIKRVASLEYV
jgi:ankyrin repeat protein